jgi:hypothetical protein
MEEHETSQETEQQLQRGVANVVSRLWAFKRRRREKNRENGAYVFILDMTE